MENTVPRYVLEVPMVHDTVTRPIVRQITEAVLENFGLVDENMEFVFNGMNDVISNNNSSINKNKNHIRLESDSRVEIDFEEELVNPLEVAIMRPEQRFVLLDKQLRVWMKPVYVATEMSLTFKIITKDRTTASMWKRRAEMQSIRAMHQFLLNLEYHYGIPDGFVKQLWVIYKLREQSEEPLNESFGAYMRRVFIDRMTILTNLASKNQTVVINELQTRVQCWFTFGHDIVPIERSTEAGAWQTSFTVRLHYDRPDAVVMMYPLIIHNQLIPSEFRDDHPVGRGPVDYETGRALSYQDFGRFERTGSKTTMSRFAAAISIPHFDDWLPSFQLPFYVTITNILVTIDPEDKTWLFTFDDENLGDYKLSDFTYPYMRDCGDYLITPFDSIFYMSVHEWSSVISNKNLDIGRELKLVAKFDPDYKNMYHVVVGLLTDIRKLSDRGRDILIKHPDLFYEWVEAIYPGSDLGNIPTKPDGTIDKDRLEDVIKDLDKGRDPNNPYNKDPHLGLVNGFSIFARKEDK